MSVETVENQKKRPLVERPFSLRINGGVHDHGDDHSRGDRGDDHADNRPDGLDAFCGAFRDTHGASVDADGTDPYA